MSIFAIENRLQDDRTRRIYAIYELVYTAVDFLAAICFLTGSVLFFSHETEAAAIWLFVAGSAFFCIKPGLRLARELHLWRYGELAKLACRAGE